MLGSTREVTKGSETMGEEVRGRVSSYPGHMSLSNTGMFTPSQLLVASQTAALMAASGLGLPGANPAAFFHPGLFASWGAAAAAAAAASTASVPGTLPTSSSPPSPGTTVMGPSSPLSPAAATALRKHNNNNNIVTSSSPELGHVQRAPKRKYRSKATLEPEHHDVPLSPPSSTGDPAAPAVTASPGPNRDKQFTCGVCQRSFGYKHVLQNHERTHTGEKPFECPECHKRFTRDHHLKTHMRLHTGERPYHCEYCDRQFVQVANLRRHLRVHTGERPYACQYCTARFSDSNQLKAHVLIHKGEKPFECERCAGRFRRRHHLLHHKCGKAGVIMPVSNTVTARHQAPNTNTSLESCSPPASDLSDDMLPYGSPADTAHAMRAAAVRNARAPAPLACALPEQTEPEDLSMSTGLHSHSSGDSPRSSMGDPEDLEHEDDYEELDDAAALFLQRRPTPS